MLCDMDAYSSIEQLTGILVPERQIWSSLVILACQKIFVASAHNFAVGGLTFLKLGRIQRV